MPRLCTLTAAQHDELLAFADEKSELSRPNTHTLTLSRSLARA